MLRHVGMDELVAGSDAEYVELAVALANEPARRRRLSDRLRQAGVRLLEDEAPVRALERFFERVTRASSTD
jgi:predicted O-linked N-acetylglucosamine transferase (SPINDLY family)